MLTILGALSVLAGAPPVTSAFVQSASTPVAGTAHIRAIQPQIYPNWNLACDDPAFVQMRIVLDVNLDRQGGLIGEPQPVRPLNTTSYADALGRARTAVIRSAPFRMPRDFEGGAFRLVFSAQRACANR